MCYDVYYITLHNPITNSYVPIRYYYNYEEKKTRAFDRMNYLCSHIVVLCVYNIIIYRLYGAGVGGCAVCVRSYTAHTIYVQRRTPTQYNIMYNTNVVHKYNTCGPSAHNNIMLSARYCTYGIRDDGWLTNVYGFPDVPAGGARAQRTRLALAL